MATYGNYKELTAQWEVNYGLSGSTAHRVFHDDTTEFAWLPEVGDALGTALPDSKIEVDNVRKTKFGGHPDKHLYEISYSTRPGGGGGKIATDPTKYYQRGFQFGGEVVSVAAEKAAAIWKWADGKPLNQKMSVKVGVGSFTIERRTTRSTFPNEDLRMNYIGRVNSVLFENFPAATVLFEGVQATQYVNDSGQIRWKLTLSFRYRQNSWQYLLRESTGEWEKTVPPIYETADLNRLLRASYF